MSTNSHDRDLRLARQAYVAAARRLDHAFAELATAEVPLDPGHGPEPRAWTSRHVSALREVAAALNAVLERRRAWDRLRRAWMPPH